MSVLTVSGLCVAFGDRELFSDASFSVEKGEKVGLIGANGTGKTTLFNVITGSVIPEKGLVSIANGVTVGVLSQFACRDSDKTVYEEALSVFSPLMKLQNELDGVNELLKIHSDEKLIEKFTKLNESFISMGGLTYKSRTASALCGLGFSNDDQNLPVSSQSGGQRAKIGLAKLLLSNPDLLLLDEPTNHLDISSMEWLQDYISEFKGAAVIISHDRYFLDKVTDKTVEIEFGKMHGFSGNYTRYIEQKELRIKTVTRRYENTMKEVSRIEGIIEQQKQFNREKNIKTAESKQKQIDRMMRDLEIPDRPEREINFTVKPAPLSGEQVLKCENLSVSFGDKCLYKNANLDVKRNEHIFILGDNGVGKTTLLKQLLKRQGKIMFGAGVKVGYFDQLGDSLCDDITVYDTMQNAYPRMTQTEIRSCLAAFLFYGEQVFKNVSQLSGGERARLMLCRLLMSGSNLLFLDEPTNHLDIKSRTALEKVLCEYGGTIIAVSHDRYFINKLSSKVAELTSDGIEIFEGGYDDYISSKADKNSAVDKKPKKEMGSGGKAYHEAKQRQAEIRKLKSEIDRTMQKIEQAEAASKEIEAEMNENSSDYEKISELSQKLEQNNALVSELYDHWEECNQKFAEYGE